MNSAYKIFLQNFMAIACLKVPFLLDVFKHVHTYLMRSLVTVSLI